MLDRAAVDEPELTSEVEPYDGFSRLAAGITEFADKVVRRAEL
jgi:hypothetical protein